MFTWLNIILASFIFTYAIYILWQVVSWSEMPASVCLPAELNTKVSVIIPCRNEEKNIGTCLKAILQQDYPTTLLEIIIADDHSEDSTKQVVENILKNERVTWKYLAAEKNQFNKKKAISHAVASSSGELMLITDADCVMNTKWVSSIVSLHTKKKYRMICGPVAVHGESNFCEKYQSLEVAGLSILSGSGIFSKAPLLCNGANIAYEKAAFEKVNGFEGNDNIPTGDDTFLLFKIIREYPGGVGYIKNPDAVVYTEAQPGWRNFLQQRIRWGSKGFRSGSTLNSIISFLVFITNFLLFISVLSSLVYFSINPLLIISLIVKFTVDFLLLNCATTFFSKKRLLRYFWAGEIVTTVYISWVGLVANFSGYNWKGRDY
jgi:cellulose synthase/poly-beta-1,6-N-acetylglucosamine synthase-like glycosyltransferase